MAIFGLLLLEVGFFNTTDLFNLIILYLHELEEVITYHDITVSQEYVSKELKKQKYIWFQFGNGSKMQICIIWSFIAVRFSWDDDKAWIESLWNTLARRHNT